MADYLSEQHTHKGQGDLSEHRNRALCLQRVQGHWPKKRCYISYRTGKKIMYVQRSPWAMVRTVTSETQVSRRVMMYVWLCFTISAAFRHFATVTSSILPWSSSISYAWLWTSTAGSKIAFTSRNLFALPVIKYTCGAIVEEGIVSIIWMNGSQRILRIRDRRYLVDESSTHQTMFNDGRRL